MALGERLKTLREEKGLMQKDIAALLEITPSAYGYYEQEKRQPDPNTLEKLADFFNVSIDYLVGRTEVRKQPEIIAAHRTDDPMKDLPPEAIEELENLKQYVLSKYRKDKPEHGK